MNAVPCQASSHCFLRYASAEPARAAPQPARKSLRLNGRVLAMRLPQVIASGQQGLVNVCVDIRQPEFPALVDRYQSTGKSAEASIGQLELQSGIG